MVTKIVPKFNFNYIVSSNHPKVFLPIELEPEVHNKIVKQMPLMDCASKIVKKDILFYPKGDYTLMSFGPLALPIKNDALEKDIMKQISEHVNKVVSLFQVLKK